MTIDPATPAEQTGPEQTSEPRRLECDLVMKGGITSGVVYPPLVLKLKKKGYRFRNIGGTSAGAIAAAVTAAAEYGRDTETGGFKKLDELSSELRQEGFVRHLFQPTGGTRPLMETVFALKDWPAADAAAEKATRLGRWFPKLREKTAFKAVRFGRSLSAVLAEKNYGPSKFGLDLGEIVGLLLALLIALVATFLFFVAGVYTVEGGFFPAWTYVVGFFLNYFAFAFALGWLGKRAGRLAGGLHDLYVTLTSRVPNNYYGLCDGRRKEPADSRRAVLTEWLDDAIQGLAGRGPGAAPLTFGDLWRWPEAGEGEDVSKRRGRRIDLRMVSANLSQNQPYVLPFERDELFIFREEELRRLFPEEVVTYLVEKGEARLLGPVTGAGRERERVKIELPAGYFFLPQAKDLPVIFATRMSLSFPLLISMIPLYTISARAFPAEEKFRIEVEAREPEGKEWKSLKRSRLGGRPVVPPERQAEWELATEDFIRLRKWNPEARAWVEPDEPLRITAKNLKKSLQPNWFSDGGICSNFPIHFFDAWLPSRPTFGVNLTSQMAGGVKRSRPARTGDTPADMVAGGAAAVLDQPAAVAARIKENVRSRSVVPTLQCPDTADAAVEWTDYHDGEVFLPRPDEIIPPEWVEISGLGKLAEAVFRTAQNYRDNMQAALPSYRERIIQVRLTDQEGGLNLDMSAETLAAVARKGEEAGDELAARFDERRLSEHKWVRFRVLMKQMESQLVDMFRRMNEDPFYQQIIDEAHELDAKLPYFPHDPEPASPEMVKWRGLILKRLLDIGRVISTFQEEERLFAREPLPMPEPVLRVTPRI